MNRRTAPLVAAALAVASTLGALAGERPADKTKAPPAKALDFADDFRQDSRASYHTRGPIEWGKGKLTLGPGASLARVVQVGPRLEWTADLEFPPLAEGAAAETRLNLMMSTNRWAHV